MSLTQREYDLEELRVLERRLRDLDGTRRADPEAGDSYKSSLRRDVAALRERLQASADGEGE